MNENEKPSAADGSVDLAPFRLGDWVINPSLLNMENGEETIHLGRRNMDVLLYLARDSGRVVSRRELLTEVWRDVVVCEEALTRVISELRTALGDRSGAPSYIQTIRKGGYRLLRTPTPVGPQPGPAPEPATPQAAPPPAPSAGEAETAAIPDLPAAAHAPRRAVSRRIVPWLPVLLLPVILILLGHWLPVQETIRYWMLPDGRQLTSSLGREIQASISPVSGQVVYSWRAETGAPWNLMIQDPGVVEPRLLTNSDYDDINPTWSPDGASIAFSRVPKPGKTSEESGVYLLHPQSGELELVVPLYGFVHGISWHPEGKELVLSEIYRPGALPAIHRINVEHKVRGELCTPDYSGGGDRFPVYSPDGKTIAFTRRNSRGRSFIYLLDPATRELEALPYSFSIIIGLCWENNDKLLLAGGMSGDMSLVRLNLAEETCETVPLDRDNVRYPNLSADGDMLIVEAQTSNCDIYVTQVPATVDAPLPQPLPLFSTSCTEGFPAASPLDGRLAFTSNAAGDRDIYLCNPDGSGRKRLTRLKGAYPFGLNWSPVDPLLAFKLSEAEKLTLCLLDVRTGKVRTLKTIENNFFEPVWSRDGRWIYANLIIDGFWSFCRISTETGDSEKIDVGSYFLLGDHPDLGLLHFIEGYPELRSYTEESGSRILPRFKDVVTPYSCALSGDQLFLTNTLTDGTQLLRLDLRTARLDSLGVLPQNMQRNFTVSREGRLYFDQVVSWESDLFVYSDFK